MQGFTGEGDDGQGFTGPGFVVPSGLGWGVTANVLDWILRGAGWERPWGRDRRGRVDDF